MSAVRYALLSAAKLYSYPVFASEVARLFLYRIVSNTSTKKKHKCRVSKLLDFNVTSTVQCHLGRVVPTNSPSRSGGVTVYVFDINQPGLPTPFYFVLVSVSVFMALSTVFHSINSSDNSPLSHSVLPVFFLLPCWSFQLYISLGKSPSALI